MNDKLRPMLEATRLTRAGQLIEATEFLQRLLRGEAPGAGASGIIEVAPRTAEAQGPQPSGRKTWTRRWSTGWAEGAARPHMPEVLRSFLERVKESATQEDRRDRRMYGRIRT